ncbi:hypothetical protein [Pseudomonas sp. GM_Psu_2]|uniref:hypothetical protein n=1 Tax=unclassified Pseudomonas TaxID=196821 RepID=UPI002269FC93|nr:hypothetical protein [Pseudomonas sp. GM_Psu_2]
MIVAGKQVSDSAIAAVKEYLQTKQSFNYGHVQKVLAEHGVDPNACDRAADRLLQQERKVGRLIYKGGSWRPVRPEQA